MLVLTFAVSVPHPVLLCFISHRLAHTFAKSVHLNYWNHPGKEEHSEAGNTPRGGESDSQSGDLWTQDAHLGRGVCSNPAEVSSLVFVQGALLLAVKFYCCVLFHPL